MRRAFSGLLLLCSVCLPGAVAVAQAPPSPNDDSREVQALLQRLSQLSDAITRNAQAPDAWRYALEQCDVQLRLALRSPKADERDNWLRMAVDSLYSAAVMSPDTDLTAYQRLVNLPAQIAQAFPGCQLYVYAALQEIQADYTRTLTKAPENPNQAKEHLGLRLERFAQEYPTVPQAPQKLLEAAQLYESLAKNEDACRCYRYLGAHFSTHPLARKAGGALWRLAQGGAPVHLQLPLLYAAENRAGQSFDLTELRGNLVVVYFWASTSGQTAEDLALLNQISDRHVSQGVEVVYVNVDVDPTLARTFLSGQFTSGTHVFASGGLEGDVAVRYGIQALPHAFLIARDGTLIRHSLQAPQLEALIYAQLSAGK